MTEETTPMSSTVTEAAAPGPAQELTSRLRTAAEYLEEHGWVQDEERLDTGEVCLTGAVRWCAPRNGDEYLVRGVLRRRGRAESWNDAEGRTGGEVLEFLRSASVTDADLADTFGPQRQQMVSLVRRIAQLYDGPLFEPWDATYVLYADSRDDSRDDSVIWSVPWAAARDASQAAAYAASRAHSWDASCDASWAASDVASDVSRAVSCAAAAALHTRDLIGDRFTAADYTTLTQHWVTAVGPVHPDDARDGLLAETAPSHG
jgi:hypothetical protein